MKSIIYRFGHRYEPLDVYLNIVPHFVETKKSPLAIFVS